MEIIYEEHARERMAEREISEEDVLTTLSDPDITRPAERRGQAGASRIYERRLGNGTCKVYIRVGVKPVTVVTVAWRDR